MAFHVTSPLAEPRFGQGDSQISESPRLDGTFTVGTGDLRRPGVGGNRSDKPCWPEPREMVNVRSLRRSVVQTQRPCRGPVGSTAYRNGYRRGNRSDNPCWPGRSEGVNSRNAQSSVIWAYRGKQRAGRLHGPTERTRRGKRRALMRRGGNTSPPDGAAIARTGLPQRTSTAAQVPQRTAATCGGQCGVCGAARPAGPRFRKPRGCVGGISCAPSGECPFRTAERRTTDTAFGAAGSASGVSASPPPRSHLTWGCIWYTNDILGQAGMRIPGGVRIPWAGIAFDGWTRP